MKIIITGFEAFLSNAENPTEQLVRYLNTHPIPGVEGLILPVVYEKAFDALVNHDTFGLADAIIMFGLAANRTCLEIERVAINVMDARGADNFGVVHQDMPIFETGKAAYFTTLPYRTMIRALEREGIKASISNSAGTYVCNDLFYRVMAHLESTKKALPAGFIHVPPFSDDFTLTSFYKSLELLVKTLEISFTR